MLSLLFSVQSARTLLTPLTVTVTDNQYLAFTITYTKLNVENCTSSCSLSPSDRQ